MQLESRSGRKERRRHRWTRQALRTLGAYRKYVIVTGAFVLLSAGYMVVRSRVGPRLTTEQLVLEASRAAVRMTVRADLRTLFSKPTETQIEPLPADKYQVNGWVDLVAESGAIQRHSYSCLIYQDEDGTWTADKLAVLPQ